MIHRYEPVTYTASKRGKCSGCGKPANRTTTFQQTLNPFNKNAGGDPKTPAEIHGELLAEAAEWMREPVYHSRCEEVARA